MNISMTNKKYGFLFSTLIVLQMTSIHAMNNGQNDEPYPLWVVVSTHLDREIKARLHEHLYATEIGIDVSNETARPWAYSSHKSPSLEQLLHATIADMNTTDNKGNTALHLASKEGFDAIVRLLILKGANKNIINNEGKTALMLLLKISMTGRALKNARP